MTREDDNLSYRDEFLSTRSMGDRVPERRFLSPYFIDGLKMVNKGSSGRACVWEFWGAYVGLYLGALGIALTIATNVAALAIVGIGLSIFQFFRFGNCMFRRFHDVGLSGFFAGLTLAAPAVGIIVGVCLDELLDSYYWFLLVAPILWTLPGFLPGCKGKNKYGPKP